MTSPVLARPDYVFEANFWDTDDGPVWTDLSSYIELQESVKVGKRRQNVFDEVAPATLSLSLDNSAGTFNNDKSSSPYVGKVVLNVPVRFRMRWPNVSSTAPNLLNDFESGALDSDYFTVDQGTMGTDDAVSAVTIDDTNADSFTGTWTTRTDSNDFNGSSAESATTGSIVTFTFTGTNFTWVGEKNSANGIAAVSIDGGTATLVDTYNASRLYNQSLFTVTGLSPGDQHVVTIKVNGTKNASSSGFTISVAAFTVSSVASPPAGQTNDIVWNTGVLDKTGAGIFTGIGPSRGPADHPVYVTPGLPYAAQAKVRGDSQATGISFKVSGRLRWYDQTGTLLSETTGSLVTLTSSYQNVAVSGTAPANATSVRFGIANETTVGPTQRTIVFDGTDARRQNGATSNYITIPPSSSVGDVAFTWVRVNNKTVAITAPTGWTLVNSWADTFGKTYLYQKVITAADLNKNYFWTSGTTKIKWFNYLTIYTGVNQSTPIHVSNEATESSFTTNHSTPNVTTTVANCWILSAVFDVSSTTSVWTPPGSEVTRSVGYCTGGQSPTGIVTDDATAHATGTYGTKTFVSNVSSRYATMHTLALLPATGTGPGNVTVQIGEWQIVQAASVPSWSAGGHWESKFTGLVDSWTERFQGVLTLTDVAATDRQKVLNTIHVESAVFEQMRQLNPIAYYKLDESDSTTGTTQEAANSADIAQPTLKQVQFGTGGSLSWGSGTGPPVDGQAALQATVNTISSGVGLRTTLTTPVAASDAVTLVCWWNSSSAAPSVAPTIIKMQDATNGLHPKASVEIKGTPGTNMQTFVWLSSDTYDIELAATALGNYFDGKTHCLVGTFALTGGQIVINLYIDGVQVANTTGPTTVTQFQPLVILGVGCACSSFNAVNSTYSNAAVYNYALADSDIADLYTAGSTAYSGDTVDERIARLLAWEGQLGTDLDQSATVVDRHMPDDQTMLDALQQASRSEGGTVYVDGEGNVAFRSRQNKEDTGTPLIIVKATQVDPSMTKTTDDELLVNKPVIKRLSTGVTTTLTDPVSVDQNGIYEKDVDTILASDQDTINYATYLLAFYSDPQSRCTTVELEGYLLQQWANVLLIDIWEMIEITNLPSTEQSSTLSLYIEGWEFDIDQDSFKITFDTSTAIPFGIVGDPVRGIVGSVVVGW